MPKIFLFYCCSPVPAGLLDPGCGAGRMGWLGFELGFLKPILAMIFYNLSVVFNAELLWHYLIFSGDDVVDLWDILTIPVVLPTVILSEQNILRPTFNRKIFMGCFGVRHNPSRSQSELPIKLEGPLPLTISFGGNDERHLPFSLSVSLETPWTRVAPGFKALARQWVAKDSLPLGWYQ